jgi:hypothetical protein
VALYSAPLSIHLLKHSDSHLTFYTLADRFGVLELLVYVCFYAHRASYLGIDILV